MPPAFDDSKELAQRHGNKEDNVLPPLVWDGAPAGTRSRALAMVDTHPVARSYVHWLVVDIGPGVVSLDEGASSMMPGRVKQLAPYARPFSPSGTQDDEFTVYALDVNRLDLPSRAGAGRSPGLRRP